MLLLEGIDLTFGRGYEFYGIVQYILQLLLQKITLALNYLLCGQVSEVGMGSGYDPNSSVGLYGAAISILSKDRINNTAIIRTIFCWQTSWQNAK